MTHINYPVGDFLIRVKNATLSGKSEVVLPSTKYIKNVAIALKNLGYLDSIKEDNQELSVKLAIRSKKPILLGLSLVSRPGLRVYMGADELESRKSPKTLLLSTSKGILSDKDAKKMRLGGEVIVEIW